eukprot:6185986-Pleurochrysis_carterae.AAC.2
MSEHIETHGEYIGRHGEYIGRHGEYIGSHGEYIGRHGEYIGRHGEYIGRHGEYIGKHGEYIWKDIEERVQSLRKEPTTRCEGAISYRTAVTAPTVQRLGYLPAAPLYRCTALPLCPPPPRPLAWWASIAAYISSACLTVVALRRSISLSIASVTCSHTHSRGDEARASRCRHAELESPLSHARSS